MSCPTEEQIFRYVNGQPQDTEQSEIRDHLHVCPDCSTKIVEYEQVIETFRQRSRPGPSRILLRKCRESIRETDPAFYSDRSGWWRQILNPAAFGNRDLRLGRHSNPKTNPVSALRQPFRNPALALGIVILIVVLGIGPAKRILNPARKSGTCPPQLLTNQAVLSKSLQIHLVNVEAMLLDVSNGEDVTLVYPSSETRQLLTHTRCLMEGLGRTREAENRLLGEIEWFLEEILIVTEDPASGFSRDLQNEIEDARILNKIHQFIS